MEKDLLNILNEAAPENEPEDMPDLPPDDEPEESQDISEEEEEDPQGVRIEDDQIPEPDETSIKTSVDLVMCIDVTGSMKQLIGAVKDFAKSCPSELVKKLKEIPRETDAMRVRVIAFRDFYQDYVSSQFPACEISRFFTIISSGEVDAEENNAFEEFVGGLHDKGGGREAKVDPESGLEALHLAFKSEWNENPDNPKGRRIVMLFTDSVPHPLDDPRRDEDKYLHPITGKMGYPEDTPRSLSGLFDEFLNIGSNARLIIYARECEVWRSIGSWPQAQPFWDNEEGLASIDKDILYKILQKSM